MDYLLGNLSSADSEHLDELSVADDEFADFLEQVENDLIDDYVRCELPQERRSQFESYYLASSERRKRVEIARTLLRYLDNAKDVDVFPAENFKVTRHLHLIAIAAALVIVFIAAFAVVKNIQLQNQIAQLKKERESFLQHQDQLQRELARQHPVPGHASPTLFALNLSPQHRDNSTIPKIKIPAGVDAIEITLKLESDDFPLYEAVLKNSTTEEILWRSDREKSNQNAVVVKFPANILRSQDYIIEVSGISVSGKTEFITGYPFQIE
jgi:hypothetical protein